MRAMFTQRLFMNFLMDLLGIDKNEEDPFNGDAL
jgi:hypothetical protein